MSFKDSQEKREFFQHVVLAKICCQGKISNFHQEWLEGYRVLITGLDIVVVAIFHKHIRIN